MNKVKELFYDEKKKFMMRRNIFLKSFTVCKVKEK